MAPRRLPERLIARVTSLAIFRNGITPWLSTLVLLMWAPVPRIDVQSLPRPPDHLESCALSANDLKMCSRSSSTVVRKQEESCGREVPEWNSVGVDGTKRSEEITW